LLSDLLTGLAADAAAVLVCERGPGWLVAVASSGLEAAAYRGARIPMVAESFAARVVTERAPVIVDDLDDMRVRNPIMRRQRLRSLLGVPLVCGDTVVGVLQVGSLRRAHFAPDDVKPCERAATRACGAIGGLVAIADREAAIALQHSLNPAAVPQLPAADIAARYVPGAGYVGGDWYDVFPLPDGRVCFVVGDVAGAGLPAAVIMGRMRSSLRSYALETSDPAEILRRLDRKIQYFEPGAMATVACVVATEDLSHCTVSLAGHPPPLLAAPGRGTQVADLPADLLISADDGAPRRTGTIRISPGALLCLYTDGLVERRDRTLDDGIAALMTCVAAGPADEVCEKIMDTMLYKAASDDLTLLTVRRRLAQA
jgi:hypothetical protein